MGRMQLKIKNWPFEKGKKVQLIWIGEPFKFNNKWMIDTYFNDGKVTKRIVQDWANIHFLSIDKYYTDGDLNSGEVIDKDEVIETIDIDLSNVVPKYNENDWRIKGSSYKSKSRTFNFYKNNKLYTIPIVEIVRSVLAPNTFMLNTILYSDTFEDYFTYEINNRTLNLYFNSNYRTTNLKDVYYNHFAWIIGNKDILKMVSGIGYNTSIKHKMIFEFNIPNFKFRARVRKTKYGYLIQEIIKVKEKRINFNEIRVFHRREREDENTKKYIKEDDDRRTFADEGGFNKTKGIEVSGVDVKSVNGELKEFIEVLNLLKKMKGIKDIEIKIVNLPLGRKISYLSDGVTRRKCLIAIIHMNNKEVCILEMERECKSISTLLLISLKKINFEKVYKLLLKELVFEGGSWSNNYIKVLKRNGINVIRYKHIKINYRKKAKNIYYKIV